MSELRFSVVEPLVRKNGVGDADCYARLRAMGIGAIETAPPGRWPGAREAGLKLLNIAGPGVVLGLNRLEHHEQLLPLIEERIVLAKENKIAQVIVYSGNRAGQSDYEGKQNCVTGLEELAEFAEKAGVTMLFEMLGTKDYPDYEADRSSFGFDVARKVGSPALKILYNIRHMHSMGEDVCPDIAENLDIIAHIRVAESGKRPAGGRNEINYEPIVKALLAAGYNGYWGFEFAGQGDPLAELARSVELFRSFA